jgi:hypothetical protein
MGKASESIFNGKTHIIPLYRVLHVERDKRESYSDAITVVMDGTTWNSEFDCYNNAPYLRHDEAESFLKWWCFYRSEIESEMLNIGP